MPPHPQELSPRSPNVAKYDDDVRRRLANSFRTAKKSVGRKLDNALIKRRIPPTRTSSSERRLRKWSSTRKLGRGARDKTSSMMENGGPDELYHVVSEGQWSGEYDGDGNGATFLAPDALNSFCSGSFDLSVHD